jgi:phage terminase large subunit
VIKPRRQFRSYLERKNRWAALVCHRRAGKTVACIQDLILKAQNDKRVTPPRRYAYIAPTRDQAKDVAWAMLKRYVEPYPDVRVNEADLTVTFVNGASIRLYSGENYDRMRGLYFDHVILDEFGDLDPQAWQAVVRPALSDYNGSATVIGTPKGRNGFWRLWKDALSNPDWFTLILKASESGILNEEELADIKRGTPAHIFEQEFECSFDVGRPGAIYSKSLAEARNNRRISNDVLWFKEAPVYTSFDVGAPLNQRCWVWQMVGDRINFLEALSGGDDCKTPADWAGRLTQKQYRYGAHFIPHDAAQENGGLWQEALKLGGLANVVPVPRQMSVWDGINLALDAFPRIGFNEEGCKDGIDSLDAYHSKEERDGVTIKNVPVHDWSSHGSDSFSLAHQAIKAGLVVDRTAIARRPRPMGRPDVIMGFRG